MKQILVGFGALAALLSCAPISEEACRGGDWGGIGLADGKAGKPVSILSKYAETCAEFGVAPVQSTYLAGREAGLQFYCTAENAYRIGREGERLNNVCLPEIQAQIRPAHDRGSRYYEIGVEIRQKEESIDNLKDILSSDYSGKLTPEQQTQARLIRSQISDKNHEIFVLEIQQRRFDSWP